jgi:hypothetical protein
MHNPPPATSTLLISLWIHSHRYYSGARVPAQPVATTGTGERRILRGIDRRGDELHDAFVSAGLDIPEDLQDVPRTIFADPGRPELDKFYDQIAWFTDGDGLPALSPPTRAVGSSTSRRPP